jgi:hypothetical protein
MQSSVHDTQRQASALDTDAFLSEHLSLIAMNAAMARDYLEAGDAPGFRYSLASLIARAKAVAGVVNDLGALADGKGSTR